MRCLALWLAFVLPFGALTFAQTTQGIIAGRVRDEATNQPLLTANVEYEQLETNTHGNSWSGIDGSYYLPLLPPGLYRVRVSLLGYQARETYGVLLPLAGYVDLDFDLRPISDVWERRRHDSVVLRNNTILPFYGPDMDPSYVGNFEPEHQAHGQLEPSLSQVMDPQAIATLPLAGRDVYAALVLQPGVTAESTTSRSLGLSAGGQRPTSSKFLLDGVEYSDHLLSGPGIQPAPEMVQEYRISTNNYSAEYGGTSGYIANVVTRSGGADWHGIGYGDWNNDILNANTFQHNVNGLPRTTLHQIESGLSAGGRIPGTALRTWTAIDFFGSRSFFDPATYILPTRAYADRLPPGSVASRLLSVYPPAQWAGSSQGDYGPVLLQEPVTIRRFVGLQRLDYSFTEKDRISARLAGDVIHQPDFFWTPYGESALKQQSLGLAGAYTRTWSPSLVSEVRAGVEGNRRGWDPALSNVPYLTGSLEAELPSSSALNGWREDTRTTEISGNVVISKRLHVLKLGAGLLDVRPREGFTTYNAGVISFDSLSVTDSMNPADLYNFDQDNPRSFTTPLSRFGLQQGVNVRPDQEFRYRYDQPYFYVQEDWRPSNRIALNVGLRYERFPSPVDVGVSPNTALQLGAGNTLDERVNSIQLVSQRGALYRVHADSLAVRVGFSVALSRNRGTVLRGGIGTFHDRPPDNFWATASGNDFDFVTYSDGYSNGKSAPCQLQSFYHTGAFQTRLPDCPISGQSNLFYSPTLFQDQLHVGYVQSVFLSLQQPLGRNATAELNGTASRGRDLLATDVLNRAYTPVNNLGQITYRTDEGRSQYSGLSSTLRYRTSRSTLSASWTWSHSIDNQSDPLLGEFFDLGFGNQTDRLDPNYYSGFTVEGNSRVDRANSDFDQRQSFVGWASFAVPSPQSRWLRPVLRNWETAAVFAVRSGLPYSTYAGDISCHPICNRRADLDDIGTVRTEIPVPGGIQLLNPSAFSTPANDSYGNTGRNEFRGPGFANLDFSISRSFPFSHLGEQTRLIFRADFFNLLNHANLSNPEAYLRGDKVDFGIAEFQGLSQRQGFPALTPLISNPRQIHILLRFAF